MYRSKVVTYLEMVSLCEKLRSTIPGSVLHMYLSAHQYNYLRVMILHCDINKDLKKNTFNFYNEFYTRVLNYKWILLIFEMCARI